MNRLERITSILLLLQTKRLIKAHEIADRFKISLRTVYRDISTLEEAGVPIISEPGLGYSLMKGYSLPPIAFTQQEANALLIGAKLVEPFTDESVNEHSKTAMDKVKSALKMIEKDKLESLDERIKVVQQLNSAPNVTKNLVQIQQALSDGHVIEIEYQSSYNQRATRRELEPIGLTFYSNAWHLIAWCRLRNDYRDFRTDRISDLKFTKAYYRKVDHKGLDDYLAELERLNSVYRIVILVSKQLHPFLLNQKVTLGIVKEQEMGEKVEMEFLTGSLHYFAQTILGWGAYVEIKRPNELKEMISFMIHELNSHYKIS